MATDAEWWAGVKRALLLYAPTAVEDVREYLVRTGLPIVPASPSSLQVLDAARTSETELPDWERIDTLVVPEGDVEQDIGRLQTIPSPRPPRESER